MKIRLLSASVLAVGAYLLCLFPYLDFFSKYVDFSFLGDEGETLFSPIAFMAYMMSFAVFLLAILVSFLVHRLNVMSPIAQFRRELPLLIKSFFIAFICILLIALGDYMLGYPYSLDQDPYYWLTYLIPLSAVIFVQILAEEVAYRGLFPLVLRQFFSSRILINLIISVVFALDHVDPTRPLEAANLVGPIYIFFLSLMMTDIALRMGSISCTTGWHFANNIAAFLIFGANNTEADFALFESTLSHDGFASSPSSLLLSFMANLACYALIRSLITKRRYPKIEQDSSST